MSGQTIADRVVEQVDEALKADIMHWAAVYVGVTVIAFSRLLMVFSIRRSACE